MKNIFIAILIFVSVALGAWCVSLQKQIETQTAQLTQTENQLAAVKAELNAKSEAIVDAKFAEARADILQKTLKETAANAEQESKKAEQLQKSLAAAKTNSPMHDLGAVLSDPKMREMIKSQQKAFMGPLIDKEYGALFKQLNLTSDQSAALKDLLQKKMMAGTDSGFSMLDGSLDATQRADLAKQVKSQTDEIDNQIKQMLGDENYQTFQTYEKTVPDRMTASQFSDQLAGSATALTADQQQQLVQAMGDVRGNFKWTTTLNKSNPDLAKGDYGTVFSEENVNKFAQEKERLDQEVLTRAQQILTPEQLAAFQDFQKAQRQMQIAGMKMAAQMFAPKNQ